MAPPVWQLPFCASATQSATLPATPSAPEYCRRVSHQVSQLPTANAQAPAGKGGWEGEVLLKTCQHPAAAAFACTHRNQQQAPHVPCACCVEHAVLHNTLQRHTNPPEPRHHRLDVSRDRQAEDGRPHDMQVLQVAAGETERWRRQWRCWKSISSAAPLLNCYTTGCSLHKPHPTPPPVGPAA